MKKNKYRWIHTGPGIYFLVDDEADKNLAVISTEQSRWTAYLEETREDLEPLMEGKGPKETVSIARQVCAALGIPDVPIFEG